MKIDVKKTPLYMPGRTPETVVVPPARFVMVDGAGDPNDERGAYPEAVSLLYALSFTIKMSRAVGVDYVVPPLEGLWRMPNAPDGIDYAHKENFVWTAMIRQPDEVSDELFAWASGEVARKKGLDASKARFETYDEGLCVQMMHIGPYDGEPASVAALHKYMAENGLSYGADDTRRHHEIYLGDPRRCAPERLRTILRLPVVRA